MQKLSFVALSFFFCSSISAKQFSINQAEEFKLIKNKHIPVLPGIDESGVSKANHTQLTNDLQLF